MANSSSSLVNNLAEVIDEIKCMYMIMKNVKCAELHKTAVNPVLNTQILKVT